MNEKIIDILYPDFKDKLLNRYNILKQISLNNNIGRRKLSYLLNLNERLIRNETEKLFQLNLIKIEQMGMNITSYGLEILHESEQFIRKISSIKMLSDKVKDLLNLKEVVISTGSSLDISGKYELSKIASNYFLDNIDNNIIIGITGGSTIGNFVSCLNTNNFFEDIIVVPVRGSLKGSLENQANNLAAKLAKKLNSKHSTFYFPDNFDIDNLKDLSRVPEINNTLNLIKRLDMLVFGIGDALKMANRRLLSKEDLKCLEENNAVAEAFGNYFDINGNIILKARSLGITLEQFMKVKDVVAIAGDDGKEKAIIAISSIRNDLTLIITEECAKNIINYLNK